MHRIKELKDKKYQLQKDIHHIDKEINDEIVNIIKSQKLFATTIWDNVYFKDDDLILIANISKNENLLWGEMLQTSHHCDSYVYFYRHNNKRQQASFNIHFADWDMIITISKFYIQDVIKFLDMPETIYYDYINNQIDKIKNKFIIKQKEYIDKIKSLKKLLKEENTENAQNKKT
jgi:hypothetical protein